jgi:hypothetical protein
MKKRQTMREMSVSKGGLGSSGKKRQTQMGGVDGETPHVDDAGNMDAGEATEVDDVKEMRKRKKS